MAWKRTPEMLVIHWKVWETGATGHFQPLPASTARAWIPVLNKNHPGVDHWIEQPCDQLVAERVIEAATKAARSKTFSLK